MNYTVSDFLNTYEAKLKLIAGAGGVSRVIKDVGILDYELDKSLKGRYFYTSSFRDQLVLTTFLCAKDAPYMIGEGVKHLLKQGAAALAFRNVFRLSIPESAIRFADSRNFPIILINSMELYFEKIIYDVNRHAERMRNIGFQQDEINVLLSGNLSAGDARAHARLINPSFEDRFAAVYFKSGEYFGESEFEECFRRYERSPLNTLASTMCLYKNGAFLFYSSNDTSNSFGDAFAAQAMREIFPDVENLSAGISRTHFSLTEFSAGIREGLYAALLGRSLALPLLHYERLGAYEIIFPFAESLEMQEFRQRVLEPVSEYDAENRTNLLDTLRLYIASGCDMHKAALDAAQHENTIRYRLEKIATLTGLDFKIQPQMEELSLAIRIDTCIRLLQNEIV